MKREFSAGGIVFNKNKVLLTKHSENHHWSFPKGLIEEGQTTEETALREVKEEGGVEAKILEKVGYSKYIYTFEKPASTRVGRGRAKIFKVVTYFLMKYVSGDPKNHDWEMEEAGWFSVDRALKKLEFKGDKELLQKAQFMLKS